MTVCWLRPWLPPSRTAVPLAAAQVTNSANQPMVVANIQAVTKPSHSLPPQSVDVAWRSTPAQVGLRSPPVLDRKRHAFLTEDHVPGFCIDLQDK